MYKDMHTPESAAQAPGQTNLIEALHATHQAIAAYIPERLIQAQLHNPQPGRVQGAFWHGSLLFADLRGFTALSEQLSVLGREGVEAISAVINQLFEALITEVTAHRGTLLKFGGDSLTAFFDADTLELLHPAAAVQAALAMQRRMRDTFAAVATRAGTFQLALRVGVHSGRFFVAEVGDIDHIELVISGVEVQRVVQAQADAAPGEVVISDQTAVLLAHARLEACVPGFQRVIELPGVGLNIPDTDRLTQESPDYVPPPELLETQIAALRPYLVRNLPPRLLDPDNVAQGEFRPVTVLFINFYDVSAILTAMADDPELPVALLNAYIQRVQTVVHQYDGVINKVDLAAHGEKLMVLFGAPVAHEDDPLRAVRCALDLQAALDAANAAIATLLRDTAGTTGDAPLPPFALRQRIGINTGTVFAGRVGGSRRYEYSVMGPAVNLAARLMDAASDGEILLSPATRVAVLHQIEIVDCPPLQLKGMAAPIVPGRVLRACSDWSPLRTIAHAPTHALSPAPLVGRETELTRLLSEAVTALRGQGRVLALVGEAGIGKTRLAATLLQRLLHSRGTDPADGTVPGFQFYAGDCQGYEQHTPYSAVRGPLRRLFGLPAGDWDDVDRVQTRCAARVTQYAPQLARFTPLLGDLFGRAFPETPLTRWLTTSQRHDRLQQLLVALFLGAAAQKPLLLRLEDVHWADASSLELLHRLATEIERVPLLLLLTYRPDPPVAETWAEQATTSRMLLSELSSRDSELLLTALLGNQPQAEVVALLERTQGNPLFIEELVRALIDSGALARTDQGGWHLTSSFEQVVIPQSIEGLLLSRLDRLDAEQHELVQVSSVIGRRFDYLLVASTYDQPELLEQQIGALITADIVVAEQQQDADNPTDQMAEGASPVPAYRFRHNLLRDVAYESILYARRRELHQRVAESLETLHATNLDEHLALLARHYLLAEAWLPAFDYHLASGSQAQQRYANHAALALLQTAIEIVPQLQHRTAVADGTEDRLQQIIEVHERIGDIHLLLGEYDAAQTAYLEALRITRAAAASRDDAGQLTSLIVRLHHHIAGVQERRADYQSAFTWLGYAIEQSTAAPIELGRCFLLAAGIYQRQGQYDHALEWTQRALQAFAGQESRNDLAHAYYSLGGTYGKLGRTQDAVVAIEQSLRLYEETDNIAGQADAHNNLANVLAVTAGRLQESAVHCQAALELKEAIGDTHGQAVMANNLGDLKRKLEAYDEAMHYFGLALAQFTRLGSDYGVAVLHMNMGATSLRQGTLTATHGHIEQSRHLFEQLGSEEFLPELYQVYAELALAEAQPDTALRWAEESLTLAQRLNARAEEGEIRRVRSRIRQALGQPEAACGELRQARTIFREIDNYSALAQCLEELARITDDHDEAAAARTEAHDLRSSDLPPP